MKRLVVSILASLIGSLAVWLMQDIFVSIPGPMRWAAIVCCGFLVFVIAWSVQRASDENSQQDENKRGVSSGSKTEIGRNIVAGEVDIGDVVATPHVNSEVRVGTNIDAPGKVSIRNITIGRSEAVKKK